MATTETRLLLLGAVALFEPVNGYQIRRELLSWRVESWANIRPGSIYNGLATLAQRGDLVRHDLRDGSREVAVYELSDQGRAEFRRLYDAAAHRGAADHTAGLPDRDRHAAAGDPGRCDRASGGAVGQPGPAGRGVARGPPDPGHTPPHALAMVDYWEAITSVERDWLVRLLQRIKDGELSFLGEPMDWTPAEDDPGHQMRDDQERYLALLRG